MIFVARYKTEAAALLTRRMTTTQESYWKPNTHGFTLAKTRS
jgi:hypothetical protein